MPDPLPERAKNTPGSPEDERPPTDAPEATTSGLPHLPHQIPSAALGDQTRDDAPDALPRASPPTSGEPRRGRTAFDVDEVVAGRYRVVRFIAQGGMGEVYEAEDLELRERVALKTIRGDVAESEGALERFRREIQLARRVTHPNVSRVFEFGRHRKASDADAEETRFLTMELLEGQTLRQRLSAGGRLSPEQSLDIVVQLAAGLATAHDAGIVHRDFKSANVILVASRRGERAVVTDFGLARAADSGAGDPQHESLTGSRIVGTPAYMAPEQAQGKDSGPAADIYALGVVMYEMVTGELPFAGDSPLAVLLKRVQEDPPSPRSIVPDIDPRWERVILRCLERDPGRRFPTATAVAEALASSRPAALEAVPPVTGSDALPADAGVPDSFSGQSGPGLARTPSRRWLRSALALLTVALLLGIALGLRRMSPAAPAGGSVTPAAAASERVVAVLGFRNAGRPDSGWLSTALSEMLDTELGSAGVLRVVPATNVARMKQELFLADSDRLPAESVAQVKANLGADLLVLGSFMEIGASGSGSQLRIDIRVQDANRNGEVVASTSASGAEKDLFALVAQAGASLRQSLGARAASPPPLGDLVPRRGSALRLYAAGLEKLRQYDALGASDLLRQAAEADPDQALVHEALARTWKTLGFDIRARQAATRAAALSAGLPREDSLRIEALAATTTHAWDRAVEAQRTLATMSPAQLDYALDLAGIQIRAGRPRDALVTLDLARKLPPPASRDSRIGLADAAARNVLNEWVEMRDVARSSARAAQEQGARLLYAQARFLEGTALIRLGDGDEGTARCEEARKIFADTNDRAGVARCVNSIGVGRAMIGDASGARNRFEEALGISRQIGDQHGIALQLGNLGNIEGMQGRQVESRRLYEQMLQLGRAAEDDEIVALALNNLGASSFDSNDLDDARRKYEEALPLWKAIGTVHQQATGIWNLAEVVQKQGRLPEARALYEESLALFRADHNDSEVAETLVRIAEIQGDQGDVPAALRLLDEALGIYRASADTENVVTTLRAKADVLRKSGDKSGASTLFDLAAALERKASANKKP